MKKNLHYAGAVISLALMMPSGEAAAQTDNPNPAPEKAAIDWTKPAIEPTTPPPPVAKTEPSSAPIDWTQPAPGITVPSSQTNNAPAAPENTSAPIDWTQPAPGITVPASQTNNAPAAPENTSAPIDWTQPAPGIATALSSGIQPATSSGTRNATSSGTAHKRINPRDEFGKLTLSRHSGKAPLKVHILGPSSLLQYGYGTDDRLGGCGFTIYWGDINADNSHDCNKKLSHVYRHPGHYRVKVLIPHLTASDGSIVDWSDEKSIHAK